MDDLSQKNTVGQKPTTAAGQTQISDPVKPVDDSLSDLTASQIIDTDIFELMGVKDMPEQQKAKVLGDVMETVQNRVIARIDDLVPEPDRSAWLKVLETKDNTKIDAFLQERDINVKQMMLEEATIYKAEMASLSQPLRQLAKQEPVDFKPAPAVALTPTEAQPQPVEPKPLEMPTDDALVQARQAVASTSVTPSAPVAAPPAAPGPKMDSVAKPAPEAAPNLAQPAPVAPPPGDVPLNQPAPTADHSTFWPNQNKP